LAGLWKEENNVRVEQREQRRQVRKAHFAQLAQTHMTEVSKNGTLYQQMGLKTN